MQLIQFGIDIIHEQQKDICETDPESISTYMKNVIHFYQNITEVFDNLATTFDYNNVRNMIQSVANDTVKEFPDQTSSEHHRLLQSVADLSTKTKEIEKHLYNANHIEIKKVVAWDDEEMLLFNLDDVLFFTIEDGNTIITTKKGKFKTRDALNTLETRLCSHGFFRCHRSFLINLKYIQKISPWFGSNYISKLEGSSYEIPISRSRLKEIKELLGI